MAAARNALGLKTEIVGVAAQSAPAIAYSFAQRKVIEATAQTRIADGMACRRPNEKALAAMLDNVARIVLVSDEEIMEAMRALYEDTHNLAEGAGAAGMAAALKEKKQIKDKRVGIVLSGGNVDMGSYGAVLTATPARMEKP
jgi:threonine dehydratase